MLHNKGKRGGVKRAGWAKGGKGAKGAKGAGGSREPGLFGGKHYWILSQFLGDYAREVYGRELVGKVPMSQKGIALALRELENKHILRSRKRGKEVLYALNRALPATRDMLTAAELMRKLAFLDRHLEVKYLFKEDEDRVVGIFGSYAKGTQRKGSDLDIFAVGGKKAKDYDSAGKMWGLDVHLLRFSQKDLRILLAAKNNLWREIASYHIILSGAERFVNELWWHYYGFTEVVS